MNEYNINTLMYSNELIHKLFFFSHQYSKLLLQWQSFVVNTLFIKDSKRIKIWTFHTIYILQFIIKPYSFCFFVFFLNIYLYFNHSIHHVHKCHVSYFQYILVAWHLASQCYTHAAILIFFFLFFAFFSHKVKRNLIILHVIKYIMNSYVYKENLSHKIKLWLLHYFKSLVYHLFLFLFFRLITKMILVCIQIDGITLLQSLKKWLKNFIIKTCMR